MQEGPLGFSYSWSDLAPIRALYVTVLVAQLVGAVTGLFAAHYPAWFDNLWAGGAMATFPGFVIGAAIQHLVDPESIGENRVMVRRMGLVAFLMMAAGIFLPPIAR
jgi:hypothetical protein